jgi:uncharacterized protein (TIGR01777 family)
MHIGLTGASGFIGREIVAQATKAGDQVSAFSRSPQHRAPGTIDTRLFGPEPDLNGIEVLIQLAGESVLGLWTPQKKHKILTSRVTGLRTLIKAIAQSKSPPRTLVVASGAGIYGDRGDEFLPETAPVGDRGFLRDVALAIEREAAAAAPLGVRVVNLRIALVLGQKAGATAIMAPLFRLGLGGRIGSGRQWMPWIHLADIAGLFLEAAKNAAWSGPVNGSSPQPIRNREFTETFGNLAHKPTIIPAPAFALRAVLREQSSLLLDSQRLVPAKAQQAGFEFRYPDLRSALANALGM